MEFLIYDSGDTVQQLLDNGFEMPIHFAAIGTNGAVVAGTYRPSPHGRGFDCQITAQTMKRKGLTSPVSIMYVDSRGEAALVVLRELPDASTPGTHLTTPELPPRRAGRQQPPAYPFPSQS